MDSNQAKIWCREKWDINGDMKRWWEIDYDMDGERLEINEKTSNWNTSSRK